MKNLIYDKDSITRFSGGYILIDNTALIDASRSHSSPMLEFMQILTDAGCDLITTQSVYHEFIRGAKSLTQSNDYMQLFKELGIEALEKTDSLFLSSKNSLFRIAFCQEAKNASYTDTTLAVIAYNFKSNNVGILTSNYRDFPSSLFEKTSYIAYTRGDQIQTHAIYAIQPNEIIQNTLSKYNN